MFKQVGLWKWICKFFGYKSISEGYTKENKREGNTPIGVPYDMAQLKRTIYLTFIFSILSILLSLTTIVLRLIRLGYI